MHVVPSVPACRAVGVIPARCADHGPAELRIAGAFCGDRTVRVGRTGKSTLLEGIAAAYGFNPEGGTRNYHFSTYRGASVPEEAVRPCRSSRDGVHGLSGVKEW